ncbi:hypothetical protein COY87_01395 [Candidatus Roizmanbacteria bacterium CG_4_10_14_0_8_um_filter_33_9]|uniref:CARDB domain-containing protein n=1 Tax=Candidatus Roizmanbacteria bacterium CG_4_10_14_0_8_um_filter_33_9 TaxID=1974826 RepID=A0A2M7QJ39_9BACT|nr:MAG: hypothetical protein COY87_01395 [Candidatus Roizmanbacteria bacterium CG_4_10_14_0_8_um_filter_33_9]
MKKNILTFCFFTILYCLFTNLSYAQQITLSLNPPIVETIIKQGKSILVGYTVTNGGDPTTMRFKIRTFSAQGTSGAMNISDELIGPVRFSLDNADLQLEEPFLLRTGAYRQAVVRMRIPEGTPDGDYYYVLLVETETTPGINGSSGSISKASVGSPLLITVTQSGKVQIKGNIESLRISPRYTFTLFNVPYQIVDSSDMVPVFLTLRNDGNNVFKPEGTISIKGGFGETMTRSLIAQNILSNSSRIVSCSPDCIFSGFFWGRYEVVASVRFNDKQSPLTISTIFIGIPFKYIFGIFITIVITMSIFIKRKRKEKDKEKYQNT